MWCHVHTFCVRWNQIFWYVVRRNKDYRYKFSVFCQVLLLIGHRSQTSRGYCRWWIRNHWGSYSNVQELWFRHNEWRYWSNVSFLNTVDYFDHVNVWQYMSCNLEKSIISNMSLYRHDDITYPSLAKAFNAPLEFHEETWAKMRKFSKPKPDAPPFDWDKETPQRTARMRMAQLPAGSNCDVLYVSDSLWVPIAVVNYNVHVCWGHSRRHFLLCVFVYIRWLNYKIRYCQVFPHYSRIFSLVYNHIWYHESTIRDVISIELWSAHHYLSLKSVNTSQTYKNGSMKRVSRLEVIQGMAQFHALLYCLYMFGIR